MIRGIAFLFFVAIKTSVAQVTMHINAHAHNDYEHKLPLFDALQNGFISVEADVHVLNSKLLVGHDQVNEHSPSLERLYLAPLDSLLKQNGMIYASTTRPFYLMIDIKTDGDKTYRILQTLLKKYPSLNCTKNFCPVKIFLSGNRPIDIILKEGYAGFALDGRPGDVGESFQTELMPVISDTYSNWSNWPAKSMAKAEDLSRVCALATQVHAEGKLLRLWAIPDNELAWQALLDAGVDLINSDRLKELNEFLTKTQR
jgi:hypothetical protein